MCIRDRSIYVAEIYREFYGQLHGITIDINKMSNIEVPKEKHEEFIKEHHEKLVSTPKEYDEKNFIHLRAAIYYNFLNYF